MSPLVSFVMPFYNNKRDLKQAIESVLESEFLDYELVLIDDCSQDGSLDIAKYYTEKLCNVKLIRNPKNLGPAGALKKGLESSLGKIIIFSAADDVTYPNRIGSILSIFEKYEDVGITISEARIIDSNSKPTGEFFRLPKEINEENAFLFQLKRNYCLGGTMAIRNCPEIFSKVGFLDLIDDYQISLEYLLEGYKIFPLNQVLLDYRVHDESVSSKKQALHEKTLKVLKRYDSELFKSELTLQKYHINDIGISLGIFELFRENIKGAQRYFSYVEPNSLNEVDKKIAYYFYNGVIKYKLGNSDDALNFWEQALVLDQQNAVLLNNTGVLRFKKDISKAEQLISKACIELPNYLDAKKNLEVIHKKVDIPLIITKRLLSSNLIKRENYLEEQE
ncbi:glycosyltransferase [Lysinibacillus sp. Ag94]|uniref:glycosyltransferase n=1 Tax=Lysinibacillus sp. Ag94 TaxID=2936682 RepID=UPI00200EBD14|nr:glycosyltransferase [Lysinibacillus sp. Ag94]UPW83770.1 glycosyltransferase [Lysinibacillus sp. Ag94]